MTTTPQGGLHTSRRTLVKGAAWSVPVVAVGGAAPAFASSPIPPRGMNGWVTLSRQNCSLAIDGRGRFTGGGDNDRGIWTFVDDPAAVIEGGIITFYFNRSDLTWSNSSGTGWSDLVRDPGRDGARPAPGFFAYTTTYSGTWTYRPEHEAWVANGQPYFTSRMPGWSCGAIRSYARRTLTVNDETITFTRGPVQV